MAHKDDFIGLERRFVELTERELRETEELVELSEYRPGSSIAWKNLLARERVILLAEAGSGKTVEMKARKRQLIEEGAYAFFISLEALNGDFLSSLELPSDEQKFEAWKTEGKAPAWFFLDAVDELKLTGGTLRTALRCLWRAVDGHLRRARVVISCRISDWSMGRDLNAVLQQLPPPERVKKIHPAQSDCAHLDEPDSTTELETPDDGEGSTRVDHGSMRTVYMLPLNRKQIRLFSEKYLRGDAEAFLEEMAKQDAWTFAGRPLDLRHLIAIWEATGQLGTRQGQLETNIAIKLKEENSDKPGSSILPDDKLRLGAERLALAMMLTRTRSVRSPEQPLDEQLQDSVLDPSSILTDWTLDERKSLLRRGLFDPATYGRVRFHHRSVQEYLAACRLRALRKKHMSTKAVRRLLFADIYGIPIVFPSMRETTAWLALWDRPVCKELIRREPESLLSLGDPESLDMATRRELVRAFATAYGNDGWRGFEIPVEQIRRIAHPDMESVIRECWGEGPVNIDVLDFLLGLIQTGPVVGCADLAHSVATDVKALLNHRIDAIRALVNCGRQDLVRDLANAMLEPSTSWPARIIHAVAMDLFPAFIGADELIALMERTPEPPKRQVGGFAVYLRYIVAAVNPRSKIAVSLRDRLADLIWRGRDTSQGPYGVCSRFDHLAPALAKLCERELAAATDSPSAELIHACVIARRFGDNVTDVEESITMLQAHFKADTVQRQTAFWADLAFFDEVVPDAREWRRFYHTMHDGLVEFLTRADRSWLLDALADERCPKRRAIALYALLWLRRQGDETEADLDDIRDRLKGEAALMAILAEHLAPPTPEQEAEQAEHERWCRERDEERAGEETQRRHCEEQLNCYLQTRAEEAFSSDNLKQTMLKLYRWFRERSHSLRPLETWDRDALNETFGAETAGRAEDALGMFWRAFPPTPWSAKSADERNIVHWHTTLGLVAVKVEASSPGWTASLTSDDACSAAAHAMTELNNLPSYVTHLAESHPTETEEVIGGEVSAELRIGGDRDHLPTLQALTHADRRLKQLCVPRLLEELRSWPRTFTPENGSLWAGHLGRVLRILSEARKPEDRNSIMEICVNRYTSDPTGPLAFTWLRGMFRFDAIRATDILVQQLQEGESLDISESAVGAFAALLDYDKSCYSKPTTSSGRLAHSASLCVLHMSTSASKTILSTKVCSAPARAIMRRLHGGVSKECCSPLRGPRHIGSCSNLLGKIGSRPAQIVFCSE